MDLFDLGGRTALVTGASMGIGAALARGLAEAGARVVLNARNAARLIDGYVQSRPIDILINNAGMQHRGPLEDFEVEAFDRLMRTNVNSAFYVGQATARHMIAQGHGRIINIASVQTALARPGIAPYTASKGAIANLTKGMATDWASRRAISRPL